VKQVQRDPEVTVGVPRGIRLTENLHVDAELFPHLAPGRFRGSLAGFHFSTGKLPQPTEQAFCGPTCDQKLWAPPHEGGADVVMRQLGTLTAGRSQGNGPVLVSEA